jgi:hypothetical protein
LRSPGRPPVARRENYQRVWASIAAGRSSEDAAIDAGVSPAVGGRWFRRAGGMPPSHFCGLQSPNRAVIYRLPSAKKSPSWEFRSMACAPLPASSGGLLRRPSNRPDIRLQPGFQPHQALSLRSGGVHIRFNVAIVRRSARRDEVELYTVPIGPHVDLPRFSRRCRAAVKQSLLNGSFRS